MEAKLDQSEEDRLYKESYETVDQGEIEKEVDGHFTGAAAGKEGGAGAEDPATAQSAAMDEDQKANDAKKLRLEIMARGFYSSADIQKEWQSQFDDA